VTDPGTSDMAFATAELTAFVEESNRIEGIHRVTEGEIAAHRMLLGRAKLTTRLLRDFVAEVAAAPLRTVAGMNVRVGGHVPPPGGPEIEAALDGLLSEINLGVLTPYEGHVAYEKLHPFIDGNGRSGRAVWAWQMIEAGQNPFALPFLHRFYYQTLDASRD